MILDERQLENQEARQYHGAPYDQKREASLWLPKVELDLEEAERTAQTVRHEWRLENERWGEPALPVPAASSGEEAYPYDQEPFERRQDLNRIRRLRFLGLVSSALEVAVAGFGASLWLTLPPLAAGAVGVAITGVYTYLAEGLWAIGLEDYTNPVPEVRRRDRILWVLGTANVFILSSLAATRFFDLTDWTYLLQLGGLSVLLPIFAAGCFVLARRLGERNRLAAEFWRLRSHGERLKALVSRMKSALDRGEEDRHV